jgi:RNA polymerase sigma factor (sigma-70 family)
LLSEKTDEELMIAYQLGEAEAFEELYSRHAPRVLSFLRKKVRGEALARDVFQSTFLKLHKFRARYDSAFPFAPWLFTICRSELLDALKKSHIKQEVLVEEVPETESSVFEPDAPEIDLERLSVIQKQAVELRYQQDFSFEEIAERLETSPGNARKLVSRAVRALRGLYGKR